MRRHFLFAIVAGLWAVPLPSMAQAEEHVRRRLTEPEHVSDIPCAPTGRAFAEFYKSGALRTCPLARDTAIAGHRFAADTWITLDEDRLLVSAWLSRDTPLAGHLCHGTGYKGFSVQFAPDQTLSLCYLAEDTVINGVPCIHGSFWTEIRGGTRSVATFFPDGSLSGCQLSRDAELGGARYRKWERIARDPTGAIRRAAKGQ